MKSNFLDTKLLEVLQQKKVFVFDFDGTITNSNPVIFRAMQMVCENYGYSFGEDDFNDVKDKPSNEYFKKMQQVIKIPLDFKKVVNEYFEACNEILKTEKLECYDYVKQIVRLFPNKVFVLASNNTKDFLEKRLQEFGIGDVFSKIVACGEEVNKQFLYENTQNMLGFPQNDCILFEDTQRYIQQAKNCNITTVGIVHDYNKNLLDADFLINPE